MEGLLPLIVLGIVAYLVWRTFRHRNSTPVRTEGSIQGPGDFACEVVGESKYQHHLERIAGGRTEEGADLRKQAVLALEDDNPHDKNAVCVRIDGLRVGYLPRPMAKMYRKRLDRGEGDRGHFGVRLDLPIKD